MKKLFYFLVPFIISSSLNAMESRSSGSSNMQELFRQLLVMQAQVVAKNQRILEIMRTISERNRSESPTQEETEKRQAAFMLNELAAAASDELEGISDESDDNDEPMYDASEKRLWEAAFQGDLDQAKQCIEHGVPINALDPNGESAMIIAAYNGHPDIVTYLLRQGADVSIPSKTGGNAIDAARWGKCPLTVIKKLEAAYASKLPSGRTLRRSTTISSTPFESLRKSAGVTKKRTGHAKRGRPSKKRSQKR